MRSLDARLRKLESLSPGETSPGYIVVSSEDTSREEIFELSKKTKVYIDISPETWNEK